MEPDFLAELLFSRGQEPQRRKRGGLAGIWDRNKHIIKPVVSGALGLVNPVLGAAAGAAMGGLDRPGKGGVGIDIGGAVRGGLQGYGAGAAGRGLGRFLNVGGGAEQAGRQAAGMVGADMTSARALPGQTVNTATGAITGTPRDSGSMVRRGLGRISGGAGQAVGEVGGRGLSRVLQFIRENPEATGMGLQAVSGIMGSQAERRLREQEQREERRRAQNLAMLVAPMYNPMGGR